MAINDFISTVWSETLYSELKKEYVGVANCSRDFEGEIKAQGDTVKINGITGVTTFVYDKNTDFSETLQTLDSTATTLEITQARAFNFQIDDIDRAQQNPKLMQHAMSEAAAALADRADRFVYGLYSQIEQSQTMDHTGVTTYMIPDVLLSVREKLMKANVPGSAELSLEVPPVVATRILKSRMLRSSDNTEAITKGYIGTYLGFKVNVSNNIYATSDDEGIFYKCYARTGRAITFAEQLNSVEAYRPENRFADAVKGLHLYGAKIVYPKELVLLNINLAAVDSVDA